VDRNGKGFIRMQEWKKEAEKYYFIHHLKIGEIAELTGISRQSISGHLKGCPGYKKEAERRKAENRIRRREYKTQKQRAYREEASVAVQVTGESLRREHDIAAMILSREKYY